MLSCSSLTRETLIMVTHLPLSPSDLGGVQYLDDLQPLAERDLDVRHQLDLAPQIRLAVHVAIDAVARLHVQLAQRHLAIAAEIKILLRVVAVRADHVRLDLHLPQSADLLVADRAPDRLFELACHHHASSRSLRASSTHCSTVMP